MPYEQTLTSYTMYSPQKDFRATFSHFQGASLDLFASVSSQNPNGFLQLDDVMPAVSGGFVRRWGTSAPTVLQTFTGPIARLIQHQTNTETIGSTEYSAYFGILATDNKIIRTVYGENANSQDGQAMTGFTGNTELHGILSRAYLYAFNGVDTPQKKSFLTKGPQTPVGIQNFTDGQMSIATVLGTGSGYTSEPTVTFNTEGQGGSGAQARAIIKDGMVLGYSMENAGQNYSAGATVTISGGGGTGASAILYSYSGGGVIGLATTGPIVLNSGRTYAVALKSSVTGHTSDAAFAASAASYTANYSSINPTATGNYAAYNPVTGVGYYNEGVSQIQVTISITGSVDPQADTVVLLATADGGDEEHLYEVAQIPLSNFTTANGVSTYVYTDTLPDTFSQYYTTGDTLLEQNLWADVDANGNPVGITNNAPPDVTYTKPVVHQGRMFCTDGESVFYSKSISEVTTSTGLITCKWEEAWPSINRLDIAFDNEEIIGLLTDTTFLYIGTTQNVYRLSGYDVNTFSVECIFRNVGVQSQDCWQVIYRENAPAGYMWVTPDNKIILSDFNSYQDIGTPIYPALAGLSDYFLQSWTYGPYSFVIIRNSGPAMFIYNTLAGTWYRWTPQTGTGPMLTYIDSAGLPTLYFVSNATSFPHLGSMSPSNTQDSFIGQSTNIPWQIRTGWQDMSDPTALKVLNEMEIWSGESNLQTALYSKSYTTAADPTPVTRAAIRGPLACNAGVFKAFYAGSATAGKLFSFQVGCANPGTASNVLDQFVTEHYPMGRF